MALDPSYLVYPHRTYGMDQDRYAWRMSKDRQKLAWPNGKALGCMIVVPLEHHMLNPAGKPFKHPGAMVTPYPDLRHYTTRDYGNRVGVFRILRLLKTLGLKATFPINAILLGRVQPLLDAIAADGHEIAAYGLSTDHIHWGGLDSQIEAGWIAEVRERFERAGLKPRTWLSPARQQSFVTLDLIAKAGFDICLDWEQDTVPVAMKTETGSITALPLSNELDDRTLLADRRQTEDDWVDQIIEAAAYMGEEFSRYGGQVLGFTLTPYISGQPFRIAALRRLLSSLAGNQGVWCGTASQLVKAAA